MCINIEFYKLINNDFLIFERSYNHTKTIKIYNGLKQVISYKNSDYCFFDLTYINNNNEYRLNQSLYLSFEDRKSYIDDFDDYFSSDFYESVHNFNFNISDIKYDFSSYINTNDICMFLDKLNNLVLNNNLFKSWNFTCNFYNLKHTYLNKITTSNTYSKSIQTLTLEFFLADHNIHKLFTKSYLVDQNLLLDANKIINEILEEFYFYNETINIKNSSTNIIFKNTEFAKLLSFLTPFLNIPYTYNYSKIRDITCKSLVNLSFINEFNDFKIINNGKFNDFLINKCNINDSVFASLTLKEGDSNYDDLLKDFTGILLTDLEIDEDITSFSVDSSTISCFGIFYEDGVKKYSNYFILKFSIKELFSKIKCVCSDLSNYLTNMYDSIYSTYSPSVLVENLSVFELLPINFIELY